MDHLKRIALILLLSVASFLPDTALADYSKTLTRYKLNIYNTYHASNTEACNYFVTVKSNAYPSEGIHLTSCSESTVQAQGWSAGITYYSSGITKYGSCNGVESEWGNGICTGGCASGYTLQNNQCVPPPQCTPPLVLDAATNTCKDPCEPKAGEPVSFFVQGDTMGNDSCVGGCRATPQDGDCGMNTAGQEGCFYNGVYTGSSCNGTEGSSGSAPQYDTPDTPEYDCIKQGKTWGTVNGQTVCLNIGTGGGSPTKSYEPSTKTTTKDANGNTTSSTESAPKVVSTSSDGAGGIKVTETTTNADGTTTTTEQSGDSYCEKNPNAEICKQMNKGSFGGACGSGFTCEGDAAQCALAREVHERNCEFFKEDAELKGAFDALKSADTTTASNLIPRETVNVVQSLDSSSSIAATCPPDKIISVMNSTVVFPISELCGTLEAIGWIFLALAYIAAARIIGGAV